MFKSAKAAKVEISPPPAPIRGSVSLPGSKSFTNRALVAASLAPGESVLRGASASEDTTLLRAALGRLGVLTVDHGPEVRVHGRDRLEPYEGELDLGMAGTSLRFLLPLCAGTEGTDVILTGAPRLCERPIGALVEALRALGADIRYLETEGCPPVRIRGRDRFHGGTLPIRGDVSSQFVSALLLAAPLFESELRLEVLGPLLSRPYIDMSLSTMCAFGLEIEASNPYRVPAEHYHPARYDIEGDASGASYFWGIAAIAPGVLATGPLSRQSSQGDLRLVDVLEQMGCTVAAHQRPSDHPNAGSIEVRGPADDALRPVTADLSTMPDVALTLGVVAAVADGVSHLSGLSSLPHKESDRLDVLHRELKRLGIASNVSGDTIEIIGGSPSGARVETHNDHRVAMAFAMLGARLDGLDIGDPGVVAKSFPGFWDELERLGFGLAFE